MTEPPMLVGRQNPTGLYLRMTKLDPTTKELLYGPLKMAWIANSEGHAIAQASFLGDEDHEPIDVMFTSSDLPQLKDVSPAMAAAVLPNSNHRIFLKMAKWYEKNA